jgi:hypothetical protein
MTTKKDTRNIYERLWAIMGEIDYIQKSKSPGMPYAAVKHDDVAKALRSACINNRVWVKDSVIGHAKEGNTTIADVCTTFINIDNPEEKVEVNGFGYGNDNQDKGPGKARSYASKYNILKNFLCETGDDPDRDSVDTKKGKDNLYRGDHGQKLTIRGYFERAGIKDTETQKAMVAGFKNKTMPQIKEIIERAQ